jgi:Zn ribbon nucleic-acid-binding protein
MFCFKPSKTPSKIHEKPKTVFGDDDVGKKQSCDLFSLFKYVENSVHKCECTHCSSSGHTDKRIEKVYKTDNEDKLSAILEIYGRLGISYGTHQ